MQKAAERAEQAALRAPWLYDAIRLRADIDVIHAEQGVDFGEYAEAFLLLQSARQKYMGCLQFAPSDPLLYEALSRCLYLSLRTQTLYESDRQDQYDLSRNTYDAAVSYFVDAISVDCENAVMFERQAQCDYEYAVFLRFSGVDPRDLLGSCAERALRAIELRKDRPTAYRVLGLAKYEFAIYTEAHCKNTEDQQVVRLLLNEAIMYFQRSLDLGRSASLYSSLVCSQLALGCFEMEHGRDPQEFFAQALVNCEQGISLQPRHVTLYNALINVHVYRGLWKFHQGGNPMGDFEKALTAGNEGLKQNSKSAFLHNSLLLAHNELAIPYSLRSGCPVSHLVERALSYADMAMALNPRLTTIVLNNKGMVYAFSGRAKLAVGEDPSAEFADAKACFEKALQLQPDYFSPYEELGAIYSDLVNYALQTGCDPFGQIDLAVSSLRQAEQHKVDSIGICLHLATVYLDVCKNLLDHSVPVVAALGQARAYLDRAHAINHRLCHLVGLRYQTTVIRSLLVQDSLGPLLDHALNRAEERCAALLIQNPSDPSSLIAAAEYHQWRLTSVLRKDPAFALSSQFEKALSYITNALSINPRHGLAHLARANVLFLLATSPEATSCALPEAEAAASEALRCNKLLENDVKPLLDRINRRKSQPQVPTSID